MKTTITLDPDVHELVRDSMRRTRKSFRATVNQALRQALGQSRQVAEKPFSVQARRLGLRPGIDSGRLNQLADELEVEAFLETTRRLQGAEGSPR
jgi:hypothetical protein